MPIVQLLRNYFFISLLLSSRIVTTFCIYIFFKFFIIFFKDSSILTSFTKFTFFHAFTNIPKNINDCIVIFSSLNFVGSMYYYQCIKARLAYIKSNLRSKFCHAFFMAVVLVNMVNALLTENFFR